MNISNNQVLLHLSLIEGIGPGVVQKIVQSQDILSELYTATATDLMRAYYITQQTADKIVAGLADTTLLDKELSLIERHNISWMTLADDHYPYLLKQIHLPPIVLYWQGAALFDDQKHLAIIGSRKAHSYAQYVVDLFVPELVARNWVIVSGGALGADSMAHQATVNANGKTVVVLGSGLLKPYPARNKQLFKDVIASGGTLLSPFPLMMDGLPGNFPARNRIISGLSKGCVVLQAAKQSGASITAHLALEQGRDVFAVPGPIDDELSAGCHALIQEGAKLVTCVGDILREYGEEIPENTVVSTSKVTERKQQLSLIPDTTPQGSIIKACAQPCSLDELLEACALTSAELQANLFELQLEGLIKQDFTGKWLRI